MHFKSMVEMTSFFNTYYNKKDTLKILDVGSRKIENQETYNDIISQSKKWDYTGFDIEPGPNVDITDESKLKNNYYDVVISGQCLEHAVNPYSVMTLINRVLKPGGKCCIITPYRFGIHTDLKNNVIDYWRILPEGMKLLLTFVDLKIVTVYIAVTSPNDIEDLVGIGEKIK